MRVLILCIDLKGTGVTCEDEMKWNARIMLITCLPYFIIQGVTFAFLSKPEDVQIDRQHPYSLVILFHLHKD